MHSPTSYMHKKGRNTCKILVPNSIFDRQTTKKEQLAVQKEQLKVWRVL